MQIEGHTGVPVRPEICPQTEVIPSAAPHVHLPSALRVYDFWAIMFPVPIRERGLSVVMGNEHTQDFSPFFFRTDLKAPVRFEGRSTLSGGAFTQLASVFAVGRRI